MTTVIIQEAQSTLTDLIHRLSAGEKFVIAQNDQPVARLVQVQPTVGSSRASSTTTCSPASSTTPAHEMASCGSMLTSVA